MANRPVSGRSAAKGRDQGRSSGRSGRPMVQQKNSSMIFVVVGAVVMIAVGGYFAFAKKDQEPAKTPEVVEKPKVEVPAEKPKVQGPAKINWDEFMPKVDMAPWKQIETYVVDAVNYKSEAETARAAGDEDKFKERITKAMAEFGKASRTYEDWQDSINRIKEGLFDAKFKSQDAKMLKWNKEFRGYLQFSK